MKFTQATVSKLTLPAGKSDAIFWDDDLAGFGVRIRAGGSKTFVAQYETGAKKTRRMTIGSANKLTLPQARSAAKAELAKVELGADPQAEKKAERQAGTFKMAAEDFMKFQEGKQRRPMTLYQTRLYLLNPGGYCRPLHDLPLPQIRRSDIATVLTSISTKNGPTAADRARAALSKFFAWSMANGMVESNPIIGTNTFSVDRGDDAPGRALSDKELAEIWRAAGDCGDYGRITRLAILTGCRRGEIAGLEWSEVQGDLICLPARRTKNHRPFDVPLVAMALELVGERPEGRKFVFGRRDTGFTGYSKAKAQLDAKLTDVAAWRFHDLRHTFSTRLHETCGVEPHIVEACINHVSGAKAGVAGLYNHSAYDQQKRQALELWAGRLKVIIAQAAGANVTQIRKKA